MLIINFLLYFFIAFSPNPNVYYLPKDTKVEKPVFANIVGYVKNTAPFNFGDCSLASALTNINETVYSNRPLGQVVIGDVLYTNIGGTIPKDGGGTYWGFTATSGSSNPKRALKISPFGVVTDVCILEYTIVGYEAGSSVNDCSATGLNTALYAASDDVVFYSNKQLYANNSGQQLAPRNYTVAVLQGGQAVYRFNVASNSVIENLNACVTYPIVSPGPNRTIISPIATVTMSGFAVDPNGTISSYLWQQISGPNTATIVDPADRNTVVNGLVAGIYQFRLNATDNSSESGFALMQVEVKVPALCNTPGLMQPENHMIWGLNGNFGTASARTLDTFVNKHGNVLGGAKVLTDGDANPRIGNFDFNASLGGVQADSTSPIMIKANGREYTFLGDGNQMIVFIDYGQVKYFDAIYYHQGGHDNTGEDVVDIVIGDLEEARRAVYQFEGTYGSPTIDYTIDGKTAVGWDSIVTMRDTGQYVVIRFDSAYYNGWGANITSMFFYGCNSPFGTKDTRISPDFDNFPGRDSTKKVGDLAGVVVATPLPVTPNYWKTTLSEFYQRGGYIGSIGTSNNIGVIDKYSGVWTGPATTPNKISLAPYTPGNPNALYFDTSDFYEDGKRWAYQVHKSPNGRILQQTNWQIPEIIPLNEVGLDPRYEANFERGVFAFIAEAAKIGEHFPDLTQGYGVYLNPDRYEDDPFVGRFAWGRIKYPIFYNESWAGYRVGNGISIGIPDGNYMSTATLRALYNKLYIEWKKVFPDAPLVMQGFAANGYEGFIQAEMLNRIRYMDKAHPLCDIMNMHKTISTWKHHIDKGYAGNVNSRGILAGIRGERAEVQAFIDTMAYVSGRKRTILITEFAYQSTSPTYIAPQDPTGVIDGSVTGLGASPMWRSETGVLMHPTESQGYHVLHAYKHYEAVMGMEGVYGYEYGDATDTTSEYRNNNDAMAGFVYNGFSVNYAPFYKPGYYIMTKDRAWLKDYRVVQVVSDSLSGQYTALYRNVNNPDSFCLFTMWQYYYKASSPRLYNLGTGITTALLRGQSAYDLIGTSETISPANGLYWLTPKPEGNYLFFENSSTPVIETKHRLPGYRKKPGT